MLLGCGRRMPTQVKGKFYNTIVGLTMLYGSECWAVKVHDIDKISQQDVLQISDVKMLVRPTVLGKIRNDHVRQKVQVTC